jgi:hypothetical protein
MVMTPVMTPTTVPIISKRERPLMSLAGADGGLEEDGLEDFVDPSVILVVASSAFSYTDSVRTFGAVCIVV